MHVNGTSVCLHDLLERRAKWYLTLTDEPSEAPPHFLFVIAQGVCNTLTKFTATQGATQIGRSRSGVR